MCEFIPFAKNSTRCKENMDRSDILLSVYMLSVTGLTMGMVSINGNKYKKG